MDSYSRDKEYIGRGLAFPLQIGQQGGLVLTRGSSEIEQAIRIILGTSPGERVMRPEFGCRIHELLFAPNNASTRRLAVSYVEEALTRWEPRIIIKDIEVAESPKSDGVLQIEIKYSLKDAHDERSIVYPFFLQGQENW
jgi:uncharacterized protein